MATWLITASVILCVTASAEEGILPGSTAYLFNTLKYDYWKSVGMHAFDDGLMSYNFTRADGLKTKVEQLNSRLLALSRDDLPDNEKMNYDILANQLTTFLNGYQWHLYSYVNPINFMTGLQTNPSSIVNIHRFDSKRDFESYISRLSDVAKMAEEIKECFQEAIRLRRTFNRHSMLKVPGQIETSILVPGDNVSDSVFYQSFISKLGLMPDITDWHKELLRTRARAVIQDEIFPSWRRLKEFIETEYIPKCRKGFGVGSLTNGADFYRACLRFHLSLDLTPEEVHQIGLNEVARIESLMKQAMTRLKFSGTIKEFFADVANRSEFKFQNADQILDGYRAIIHDRIAPTLDSIFKDLPNKTLVVKAMSHDGTAGTYSPVTETQPGVFMANVMRPTTYSKVEMVAMALHETIPGHHLQASYQLVSPLPNFRKAVGGLLVFVPFTFPMYTAYTEGWGLYAEFLGEELGLYQDEYELMGRYSMEIFRACRLVVDTGIHVMGWDRERAVDYMSEYSAKSRPDIENQVDRYATFPGQACAYKIGEMKIRELRDRAEHDLGEQFDVKEFHSTVLNTARVPLKILEKQIHEMITSAQTLNSLNSASVLALNTGTLTIFVMTSIVMAC